MNPKNFFSDVPSDLPEEIFEPVVTSGRCTIERIISKGHASPAGSWYDQDTDEWVMVLSGRARLEFAESGETIEMKPGDYINIPAHEKHRVAWTDPGEETIWLAVHYS